MKKVLFVFLMFLSINHVATSQTWTGDIDTDWSTSGNWQGGILPQSGDTIKFNTNAIITGSTMGVIPNVLLVQGADTITLDLDLTLGDGTFSDQEIVVVSLTSGVLNFGVEGNNRTFNINGSATKNAFKNKKATIKIASSSILNIIQANTGMSGNNFINNGTINISAGGNTVNGRGIQLTDTSHTFINNGILNIEAPNQQCIEINSKASFTNNGTINCTNFKWAGIVINTNAGFKNTGAINIEADATGVGQGIDVGEGGTFENILGATITIDNLGKIAFRVQALATSAFNSGSITINDTQNNVDDGVNVSGTFINDTTGIINIGALTKAGVRIADTFAIFTNRGIVNTTAGGNGLSNAGLNVKLGIFENTNIGILNADGGMTAKGKAISIDTLATLNNSGIISAVGGQTPSRVVNSNGTVMNHMGGIIDMTDGRYSNFGASTLTNNGLFKSSSISLLGIQQNSSLPVGATNNGFYSFGFGTTFSGGSGTTVDNGINLNDQAQTTIDAANACTIDIAQVAYEWFVLSDSIASADSTGSFTFPAGSISAVSSVVLITTEYGDSVKITVENICAQAALPVELLNFSAEQKAEEVLLSWATGSEVNNDFFSIEKSTDGSFFKDIGTIRGAGNSSETLAYHYIDEYPVPGVNFYRLKQMDFDGRYEYSDVKSIYFDNQQSISVFPNPVNDIIKVRSIKRQDLYIQIFDLNGKLVYEEQSNDEESTIDLSMLVNGIYSFTVRNSNKKNVIFQDKLVKVGSQ